MLLNFLIGERLFPIDGVTYLASIMCIVALVGWGVSKQSLEDHQTEEKWNL